MSTQPVELLPELNLTTLLDLVKWAELSEALRGKHPDDFTAHVDIPGFEGWGLWEQGNWAVVGGAWEDARNGVCGTAFCGAGQAAHLAGYRMLVSERGGSADSCILERPTGRRDARGRMIYEDVPGAVPRDIDKVGAEELGLTHGEAELFFEGGNDVTDWQQYINQFSERRGMPHPYPDMGVSDCDIDDTEYPEDDYDG